MIKLVKGFIWIDGAKGERVERKVKKIREDNNIVKLMI
jgi:hypothetical protein